MESENETTKIETKAQLQYCGLGVSITRHAWTKLMAYCRATNLETSGFFLYERDGDLLWIDEVYLLPQESTGTSTEMDRTAIAKFQLELYKAGVIGKKDSRKRLGHWHTHPTFNVFWSGTDMEMRRLNTEAAVGYFLSIVVNQKGEALAAIDIKGDWPMAINDLPIEIVDNQDVAELIKACKAEVELKVKSPTPAWQSDMGYGRTYYDPQTQQWGDGKPGEPERLYLENEPPALNDKTLAELKVLGPGDRRTRKALKHLEKMTARVEEKAGKQSWADWKIDQQRLDNARAMVRECLSKTVASKQSKATEMAPVIDMGAEGDIRIVSSSVVEEDVMMSDESGTYQNIAGEIVKVDDPSQVIWD